MTRKAPLIEVSGAHTAYKRLMAEAWAATGHMRYRDIAREVGMPHATVHRLLTGSTSGQRHRVVQLLRWIYGPHQNAVIAETVLAHDQARQVRIDVARRNRLEAGGLDPGPP